jgi:hypothetical protein
MLEHEQIVPLDHGGYAIGLADEAPGPFLSRLHAAAVLAKEPSNKKKEVRRAAFA